MILFAAVHDDDLGEDEEELNDLDELDEAGLDDSVLDELAEEGGAEDDTMGFGRIEEDEGDDDEEDEEEEGGDEALPEEDAEDVDYDTFDDIDEM